MLNHGNDSAPLSGFLGRNYLKYSAYKRISSHARGEGTSGRQIQAKYKIPLRTIHYQNPIVQYPHHRLHLVQKYDLNSTRQNEFARLCQPNRPSSRQRCQKCALPKHQPSCYSDSQYQTKATGHRRTWTSSTAKRHLGRRKWSSLKWENKDE
jgi:hypothetical protein